MASNAIDDFDIFDLMGLHNMSLDQKQQMLTDMNTVIWDSFLAQRLRYLLTSDQLEQVKQKIEEGLGVEDVLKAIVEYVPNLNNLLAEYTREAKVDLVIKHHQAEIKEGEQLIELAKDDESKLRLHQQREKHIKALEFMHTEEWDKVVSVFAPTHS